VGSEGSEIGSDQPWRPSDYEANLAGGHEWKELAMSKRNRITLTITLGVVIIAGLWFVNRATRHTQEHRISIRVGYLPYSSALPFFVADEKGYFAERGIQVQAVKLGTANEAIDALRSGSVDFIVGVGLTTFFSVEQASPGSFKLFQPCGEDASHAISYLLVPAGSPVQKPTDLTGKRVGTYKGTSQVLVLRLLLQRLGLDPSRDVRIGDVASNLQVDALAARQFDAFLMLEPYATRAMILHGARPLIENPRVRYILDPFPAGANAVSTKFLRQLPGLTSNVVAALDKAIVFIRGHEREAKGILPKYDPSLTLDIAESTHVYRWWTRPETDINAIQRYADLLYEGGELRKQMEVKGIFLEP
jgi:NitT/TauT family transport system substrate-binding protein